MPPSSNGTIKLAPVPVSETHTRPDPSLTPIAERSHENSTVASIRSNSFSTPSQPPNDITPAPQASSWWFWLSAAVVAQNGQQPTAREQPNTSQNADYQSDWWVSTRRIVTFGMYTSHPGQDPGETEPLLSKDTKKSPEQSSWFSWLWGNPPPEDEDSDDEYTDDIALFRSAKLAVESSRESCSYACRHSMHSQFLINESELAVAGSTTEFAPVKYNARKPPLMHIELQEAMFAPVAVTLGQTATSTPTVASSNSSVKSIPGADDISPEIVVPRVSLVIPDLEENYRTITFLTRLRLIGQHILFQHNSSESHLYRLPSATIASRKTDKIKKVVIIGVHGFLPTKFVKSNIGRSTGNANKIVQDATQAVEQWLNNMDDKLYEVHKRDNMYNIDTIALEGQGNIADRVNSSLDLLSNWLDVINECDFLFLAGHSQGALIAIHLLSKMLTTSSFRLNSKKIGLLSMAAPLLGPSKSLDAKIVVRAYTSSENEVLREFLQFSNPQSAQSLELHESLQTLVHHNVKITLSGSANDLLIPIDSALASLLYHPNLFRCLYIDKDSTIPLFIAWMWKLVLITRNVGHIEHGISRFLAPRCMGLLVEGGHCGIMAETSIYKTSIKHALETTDLNQKRGIRVHEDDDTENLFKFPWNVRELIEDVLQTKHITSLALVNSLLHEYRSWEPTTKSWREIKQTLQALTLNDPDDLLV